MNHEEIGRRERKRAQTRQSLEAAAVELVVRDGLEQVTVEAISTMADVSIRTFFNYFDSKEDAILGIGDADVAPIDSHLASGGGGDVVEAVVGLFISVFEPAISHSISDSSLHHNRLQVIRRYPELLSRQMARMTRITEQLTEAVQTLMTAQRPPSHPDSTRCESTASVMVMTCGAALRAAIREWAEADTDTDISLDALHWRATALVRETTDLLR